MRFKSKPIPSTPILKGQDLVRLVQSLNKTDCGRIKRKSALAMCRAARKRSVVEMEMILGIDKLEPVQLAASDALDREDTDCFKGWYEDEDELSEQVAQAREAAKERFRRHIPSKPR